MTARVESRCPSHSRIALRNLCVGLLLLPVAAVADVCEFTSDAIIDCNDVTCEGRDVIVNGCTVTIECEHHFASLRVINNGVVTTSRLIPTHLIIDNDVEVDAGSTIHANGRGFMHSAGVGQGCDGDSGGGAGYGGAGGRSRSGACGGRTYAFSDDPNAYWLACTQPTTFGSGGGDSSGGCQGGAGGGVLRLTVNGTLTVDGEIRANGSNGEDRYGGGGSGGSIWITATTLEGTDLITANGGRGGKHYDTYYGGGGGGGRIAIYADNKLMDDGQFQACGGNGYQRGGAGTVYVECPIGSQGLLIVNNCGISGALTEFCGEQEFDTDLYVVGEGQVGPPTQHDGLHLIFNGDVEVDSGGHITANGRGFIHSAGEGQGCDGTYGGGAGYGGAGGRSRSGACGGRSYAFSDDPNAYPAASVQPTAFGSGGGDSSDGCQGGAGGGVLRLTVNGTLTVDGEIRANGSNGQDRHGGGGSGGSIWITATTLDGTGLITANGGRGGKHYDTYYGGGGGGGRIAIYADNKLMDDGQFDAYGGNGYLRGGAGTVYVEWPDQDQYELIVDNGDNGGALTEFCGEQEFGIDLYVVGEAKVGPPTHHDGLHLIFNGDVKVDSRGDSRGYITASGRGCGHSAGPGAGCDGTYGGGAGYGGAGGRSRSGACGGEPYCSPIPWDCQAHPIEHGSGGGDSSDGCQGGAGGGVLRLTVNGTLTVNGEISAHGSSGQDRYGGGGSGGSIWITATILDGAGLITANGGRGGKHYDTYYGGGGGGGRIAIYTCDRQMDDSYITGDGGAGYEPGELGTVFFGSGCVSINEQPEEQLKPPAQGEIAMFTVDATGCGPVGYQWRREGEDLTDEPGHIVGATSSLLVIMGVEVGDLGHYDVVVTDDCGPFVSTDAPLTCPGDVDRDIDVDLADLAALLASYRKCAGDPEYDPRADFDGNGCVDLADLATLLAYYRRCA